MVASNTVARTYLLLYELQKYFDFPSMWIRSCYFPALQPLPSTHSINPTNILSMGSRGFLNWPLSIFAPLCIHKCTLYSFYLTQGVLSPFLMFSIAFSTLHEPDDNRIHACLPLCSCSNSSSFMAIYNCGSVSTCSTKQSTIQIFTIFCLIFFLNLYYQLYFGW